MRPDPNSLDKVGDANDELDALRRQLAELRDKKGQAASAFGDAKRRGADLAPLKREMQAVTAALKAVGSRIKSLSSNNPDDSRAHSADGKRSTSAPRLNAPSASQMPVDDGPVRIIETSDDHDKKWTAYVAAHSAATLCHDIRWRRTIQQVFGHRPFYLHATDANGKLRGVLPLVRQSSRLFGNFMTSIPLLNYGGALADSAAISQALMNHAGVEALAAGCTHVEFRDREPSEGWPARTDKIALVRTLPADEGTLDKQLGAKVRAQIKRSVREGATAMLGGVELLDDFYQVFAHNMRDLGTPVYPKSWFQQVCSDFRAQVAICVVRHDGHPVAAGFLMRHQETVEIPWASTIRKYNPLGVNMLLYWHCLCWSIAQGCSRFDFGRSTADAGTYRFKLQWGAEPQPLFWHYWLAPGAHLPKLNPDNPRYRLAIRVWQRMPVWVTRIVGPPIVKYLP